MPTVSLDNDFEVFADVDMADEYMDGALHGDSWRELDDDTKGRALVTSTRVLNRQRWKGTKTEADQALAFPRVDMNITPEPILNDDDIPVDIVSASIELALALVDGSEAQNEQTTAERFSSISAGSVSISNYRTSSLERPTRFPLIVQELLKPFLGGSGIASFYAKATGVDGETIFPIDLGHTGGI